MTYDQVATHFGVRRCQECAPSIDHARGQQIGNTIHWRDRRLTRAGLRHFLILIAGTRLVVGREKWRRLWAYNVWAASVARKELHITIPLRLSLADRAYVRWHIQSATNVPAAARVWANNKEATHGHDC